MAATRTEINRLGERIWSEIFGVKIQHKFTLDPEVVREIGVRSSTDPERDKFNMDKYKSVYMNVDDIYELYKRGVEIRFKRNSDLGTMYDIVNAYLEAWADFLTYAVNDKTGPIEDLIGLDDFASTLLRLSDTFNGIRQQETIKRGWGGVMSHGISNSESSLVKTLTSDSTPYIRHQTKAPTFKKMLRFSNMPKPGATAAVR